MLGDNCFFIEGTIQFDYRKHLIAAAIAAAAVASPAAAAPATATASARALLLLPLQLTKVDDLDFGTVIPSPVSGTVTINATTGKRSLTGGVVDYPSDVGHRAYFGTAGSPAQLVFG